MFSKGFKLLAENCRVDEVNFREKDKIRQEAVKIVLELP
jgi:hypothetical protein